MKSLVQKQAFFFGSMGRASIVLAVLVVMVGCGYHPKGMGLTAPRGVHTIAVTVLENRT